MDEHQDHENLIEEIAGEYAEILRDSDQAIYIFLDDNSKVCNSKFAKMLGYDSPEDWAGVNESFTQTFVEDQSQEILVSAYKNAMEKMVASQETIAWKSKSGEIVKTQVILVPIAFKGHLFALHFVNSK